MSLEGKAVRVIIYMNETDHYQKKPLYMALLQMLKQEGASGATVVRGLAGFGAHSRIHTMTIVDLSLDLPLRLEWVDRPELVERLLPTIQQMVNGGLMTVEEVNVVPCIPGRQADPLAQSVQAVMQTEVLTVSPSTLIADVVALLLQKGYRSLPVVDDSGRILGLITDGDLLRRAGLRSRLDLQIELPAAAWQQQLADLRTQGLTAAALMTTPVITIPTTASLRVAAQQMIDHHLKRLPVVTEDNQLSGWISRIDILRSLEYQKPPVTAEPESVTQGHTIAELLYRDVATVTPQSHLDEILLALERNRRRRIVVVDGDYQVVGIITDGDILQRSRQRAHPGLLERLRTLITGHSAAAGLTFADNNETAADLMTTPVITIGVEETPAAALRLMVQHGIKRLPVVDGAGRLVGLLGRASLLKGLMEPPSGPG